jgi:hypothetical protein
MNNIQNCDSYVTIPSTQIHSFCEPYGLVTSNVTVHYMQLT